tara:strand:+ start:347 stop:1750 length:1404 start_codon:yes stop_codon:yes gene_type:complete
MKRIKLTEFEIDRLIDRTLLKETGIRDINKLAKRYPKAEIYFHQDTDGVTTAIAMREYLKNNGIDVVDSHVIQYGEKEFQVKKPDASGDIMPVLVDFAHGKPQFTIHTDHHDSQSGVEKDTSTQFRGARSNVETISQIVSPQDIFPNEDIALVSAVDSADFVKHNITPDDVMNLMMNIDKEKSTAENRKMLALLTNKLLLAYKNKPKFLESLVMNSSPSLLNILLNIKKIAKEEGYATPEEMLQNQLAYVERQKTSDKVKVDDGIIIQYGGGYMVKPGSYDRYVPFKNNPDANFLVIAWPMGLVQASCNPFKKERSLKGINLGEIAQEVLENYKAILENEEITADRIKYISERKTQEFSAGFNLSDLMAFYGDKIKGININQDSSYVRLFKDIMDKPQNKLSDKQQKILKSAWVSAWDIIKANSGGHKCITNISGLMYLPKDLKKEMIVGLQKDIVLVLKDRIKSEK